MYRMRHTRRLPGGGLSAMPASAVVYAAQGGDLFWHRRGAAVGHTISCDRVRGHMAGLEQSCSGLPRSGLAAWIRAWYAF
jgi:hypothetical protein